ncbi:MAG: putative toxin-antitoxin system toxin component, PIN family [Candidatus Saccharimonadales bacterium]
MISSKPISVVIDSNIWISALVFGGTPRQVFEHCVRDGIRIVVSEQLLSEIRRNLHSKFPDFVDDFESLRIALHDCLDTVRLGALTIDVCRDPDDNMVLETAVLGAAESIVSGDKDVLTLQTYQAITVLNPAQFIASKDI